MSRELPDKFDGKLGCCSDLLHVGSPLSRLGKTNDSEVCVLEYREQEIV